MNGLTSSNLSCPHEVSVRVKLISMKITKEGSLLNILCNENDRVGFANTDWKYFNED